MKEKFKKTTKEILTLLGFSLIFGIFLCKPLVKEWFKKDYYVVVDNVSAEQEVEKANNIEVEFRCQEQEFPQLLALFKKSHKEFYEVDNTTLEEETPFFDDEDSTKSYIVSFFSLKN